MSPTALTEIDKAQAIIHRPLTIPAAARAIDAVRLMSTEEMSCSFNGEIASKQALLLAKPKTSCVLVVEKLNLLGIFTEQDAVRLKALDRKLEDIPITTAMSRSVFTLRDSDFTDLFVPLALFQQHNIRHIPIIDQSNQLVGLLTQDSLQSLFSEDLFHLHLVSEIITDQLIRAEPTTSLIHLTHLMTRHQTSSVVLVEQQEPTAKPSDLKPLGVITEHDIVQCLALELDFSQVQAFEVMAPPPCLIQSDTSLWAAQKLLQTRQINQILVTNSQGSLLGTLNQNDLLKTFNPMEINRQAVPLEQKGAGLETETREWSQQNKMEPPIHEGTTIALPTRTEREHLLSTIALCIRESFDFQTILNITVAKLRSTLQCDRTLIYQFQSDGCGVIVAESVGDGWTPSLHHRIDDPCFRSQLAPLYQAGRQIAINNIYAADYGDCYLRLLEQYQVKSILVVPILAADQLWGLLIGHHCTDFYPWQTTDLALLRDVGIQLRDVQLNLVGDQGFKLQGVRTVAVQPPTKRMS